MKKKKVILDTSFILSCVKEKKDFIQAEDYGEFLLPELVVKELKKKAEEGKGKEREVAELALEIIRKNKKKFRFIKLEKGYVDAGILKYAQDKERIIVATLDRDLKRKLKGKARILTLRARKKLVFG